MAGDSAKQSRNQKRSKGSKKEVNEATKKYVKKQLDKNIEDKMYMADLVGAVSGDSSLILTPSSSTLPQYYQLIPSIAQGDGLQQRSGTRVKLKKCVLDCQLLLSEAARTAGVDTPMNIYYFILQDRDTPATLSASDLNQLFYYTGGTTQFLSGSGWATTHQINDDYFKVIKTNYPNKPIKLGYASYDNTGINSNNDYKSNVHFKIDYTRQVEKVLRFNNQSSTCLNHNWYLCVYVQKQGLNTTTVNWDAPQLYVSQLIKYEDA